MLNNLKLLLLVIFLSLFNSVNSQTLTGYELGILVGPVQMRSDFGLRGDKATNRGNIGFGAGLMFDINPMDWGSRRDYAYDHFKLRFDLSFNKTSLQHYGEYVDPDNTSENANKLRAQRGEAKNSSLGVALEYYPLSLRGFFYNFFDFTPYLILGVQYTYAKPGSNITNEDQLYGPWANKGSINTESFYTMALNTGIGVRYKVSEYSDFLFETKFQFFNSDWVDGLNHPLDYNENNDALIWFTFGYVYYLN
ncbi:THC0290_0291 family protein [Formosa sp. PL04]|uniref:THC0290_0291 family protein n=1 Tax=Formosa sp. PL04 TaxID=3081755 RepID=UPI002981345E|nr:glutamate dehydrogenase [Formosa sp. PL04]MDW5289108.1 glutamate dehydrogenase [Formosa sp. PL04]